MKRCAKNRALFRGAKAGLLERLSRWEESERKASNFSRMRAVRTLFRAVLEIRPGLPNPRQRHLTTQKS